jgi:peroxiredoxin
MHAYRDQYAQLFNLGQDVILLAISADTVEELYSWARDDQFPFLMLSDVDTKVGAAYGALRRPGLDNRNLFIVGRDGKIAWRTVPFREIDPTAYTELGEIIDELAPPAEGAEEM